MNFFRNTLKATRIASMLAFFILLSGCTNSKTKVKTNQDITVVESDSIGGILWSIKAVHPEGILLDVKAIDKEGNTFDVKAIQNSNQTSLIDINAFVKGKILPIKILVSEDKYLPVKAIDTDGTIIDVKALTADGQILDVKGVSQSGNIIHIKAINSKGEFYTIEAISPKGWINDVNGIKMFKTPIEATINGVDIFAHVKAIPKTK